MTGFTEKGLSLLEVMVTMFLITLISSSLMGGFIISNRMIKQAEQETCASNYAYQILEDLRARSAYEWVKLNQNECNKLLTYESNGNYGTEMQAVVSVNKNQENPSLYHVQVLVSWENYGRDNTMEMVTILNPLLREAEI